MNAPTENRSLITAIKFDDLRLPYVSLIGDAFGIDNVRWKVLTDSIFPSAKSTESVVMALTYCKARGLDIFKRPVHIVPMWSSILGKEVETVWPGVSELRTTAFRTKQYAGCDAAEFGPNKTHSFKGRVRGKGKNAPDEDIQLEMTFPEWCQITVHRLIGGRVVRFSGQKVYWLEAYARRGKADVPNDMWCKRPFGQLEKCAEAAALRRAFPEEIGNELTAEEMEGQQVTLIEAAPAIPTPPTPPAPPKIEAQPEIPADALEDFNALHTALDSCPTLEALNAMFEALVSKIQKPEDKEEAQNILHEVASKFPFEDAQP
jgi:phage recombination protein Bet